MPFCLENYQLSFVAIDVCKKIIWIPGCLPSWHSNLPGIPLFRIWITINVSDQPSIHNLFTSNQLVIRCYNLKHPVRLYRDHLNTRLLKTVPLEVFKWGPCSVNWTKYSQHPKTEPWSVFGFNFMPVPDIRYPDRSKTGRHVWILNGH